MENKKRINIGILVFVILIGVVFIAFKLTGSKNVEVVTSPQYNKISSKEAKEKMDSTDTYIIIDVRTKEEYKEGHIENAILIPDYEIKDKISEVVLEKDKKILLYCRSGRRSEGAARKLVDLGYENVYDFGGINDWEYGLVK